MPRLEEIQGNKTFADQIGILIDYISPFKQMWPFYWLKVAAVRDPKVYIWRLCYFALIGRWDDGKPIPEPGLSDKPDRGNAIVAISQLIDADRAWEILTSLEEYGSIELSPDITASAILDPSFSILYWQESTPQMPKAVTDVAESADWRYLYAWGRSTWSRDNIRCLVDDGDNNEFVSNEYAAEERIRRVLQPDLDQRSLRDFQAFTSTRLGLDPSQPGLACSIKDFLCDFDLPLALRVERGVPDRSGNTLPLTIYCRRPLTLETLKVSVGNIWLPDAEVLSIEAVSPVEDGWSVGEVTVPYTCGKVWFASENLAKALPYDIPIPTVEDQVREVLGSMYHPSSLDEGKRRWEQHLLVSDGTHFEIALLNAIARFGIPVLFAGQVQHEGQAEGGGTSTRGYDLVALNLATRQAVLISAKGSRRVPTDDDCQKLLDGVESVAGNLQGWYVTGIIACHAPDNRLGRFRERTDLRVWSREDLEQLYQADKRESIEFLLWPPLILPGFTDWGFLDSH